MSENNDEELKRLREELKNLQERLNLISGDAPHSTEEHVEQHEETGEDGTIRQSEISENESKGDDDSGGYKEEWRFGSPYRRHFDFGDRLGEYISGFVEDVMEGVSVELERSLFRERPQRRRQQSRIDSEETAKVMASLGNEHRIKILNELSYGGLYASDLQEVMKEISPSTLSSHLDILEEAGLIYQERKRGRYLITIPGRLAIKMAYQIAERIVPNK